MENIHDKAAFLQSSFTAILRGMDAGTPRKWGKMNLRQMIEHMSEYVRIANGRVPAPMVTEPERLPRMKGFLASAKPFPENTPNVLLPDTPPPVKHATNEAAIDELQHEIDHFFAVHNADAARKTINPFFGELDFEEQVQLLYKHSTHHLRQFGWAE